MKRVKGRSLRPAVCSCSRGCRSREEMRKRHGTPAEFLEALGNAFEDGFISWDEAERANLGYRAEWHEAPEHTKVSGS